MKHIVYECGLPNTLSGGFGDRIIGIASCLSLCEKLNCELSIKWHDCDITDYFDLSHYDFFKHTFSKNIKRIVNHQVNELKDLFLNKKNEDFQCDTLLFNTNQNIWIFLNTYTSIEEYEQYTHYLFKTIFNKYLVPKEVLTEQIKMYQSNIGIQLRFGDVFMHQEHRQLNYPQEDHFPLGKDIEKIRNMITAIILSHSTEKIFITSDINIYKVLNISNYPNIIYIDKQPVHLERSQNKSNMDKTFIDFFILSKCNLLYITYESNFGRIPAILKKDNNISIDKNLNIHPINIRELSYKL
jgi:hypothetical protein